ncbi:MAG: segregation/condensation protein A [Syntrophales bacterium]|nr:segregation/condensation protein A [Syntrophales bacterium]PKN05651.1 MAG: segregation/condensation protein A [Deltaproteobacteria bacterium HGW-Deltaproteobacteria-9]
MAYEIKLDIFEGPLDLLLYLIKKNEIDIYDIPIALITRQYLEYIEMLRSLNLDLAGEFLVLAATLLHIKSRLLLPVEEDPSTQDEEDPRAELVRQLLDYQAFKEAALELDRRPVLERDVFTRLCPVAEPNDPEDPEVFVEMDVFDLVRAFQQIFTRLDKADMIEIEAEEMSLADRINEIMDRLMERKHLTFTELIGARTDRRWILYTFLALLELMKLRMIKAYQSESYGAIRLFLAVE